MKYFFLILGFTFFNNLCIGFTRPLELSIEFDSKPSIRLDAENNQVIIYNCCLHLKKFNSIPFCTWYTSSSWHHSIIQSKDNPFVLLNYNSDKTISSHFCIPPFGKVLFAKCALVFKLNSGYIPKTLNYSIVMVSDNEYFELRTKNWQLSSLSKKVMENAKLQKNLFPVIWNPPSYARVIWPYFFK